MKAGLESWAIAPLMLLGTTCVLAGTFEQSIQPVLEEHCLNCHSAAKQKGDLDLERFSSVAEIKKHPMIWQGVLEQIQTGEMPPKKEPLLSAAEKKLLLP